MSLNGASFFRGKQKSEIKICSQKEVTEAQGKNQTHRPAPCKKDWHEDRAQLRFLRRNVFRLMKSSLKKVLTYSHPDLVDKIAVTAKVDRTFAQEIFQELLKWLWLCAEAKNERKKGENIPRLVIDEPLYFLDIGWHEFILFTQDYANFCEKYFGFFIHHNPTPVRKKQKITRSIESNKNAMELLLKERRRQYEYIFDKLGAETLTAWYETFGNRLLASPDNSEKLPTISHDT